MFDAEDPGTIINEFLLVLFVPGILLFAALWAAFRLAFDDALRSMGLAPIEPAMGAGAIAGGYGRFVLLIVVTTLLLLPYAAVYRRFVRDALRARGIV
ncbi:hypothetical protein SY89_00814 [Halolamina pelagica]|uniref:Uncharacterized protein n=1 Tax=Halolamina pelagica TaxID=699431 RepID=A0A0P7GN33_9EURY|nr:hypothetical protein [Halolamina pelagica]KPN30092.1 hypothetical protein SY89_00814 [Halolamina pelagica]